MPQLTARPSEKPLVRKQTIQLNLYCTANDNPDVLADMVHRLLERAEVELVLGSVDALHGRGLSPATRETSAIEAEMRRRVPRLRTTYDPNLLKLVPGSERITLATHRFCTSMGKGFADPFSLLCRRLQTPVLFVRADETYALLPEDRSAVACISLQDGSRELVRTAARMADWLDSSLQILHAVDPVHDYSRPDNLMSVLCGCEILARCVGATARLTFGSLPDELRQQEEQKRLSFIAIGVAMNDSAFEAVQTDRWRDSLIAQLASPALLVPTRRPDAGKPLYRTHREHPVAEYA